MTVQPWHAALAGLLVGTVLVIAWQVLPWRAMLAKWPLTNRPPMPHRVNGGIVADLFQITGFGLMVTGVALYSVPMAYILAGAALFHVGGLAARR